MCDASGPAISKPALAFVLAETLTDASDVPGELRELFDGLIDLAR